MRTKWDQTGEHLYQTGVDHMVAYPYEDGAYGKAQAWNGITAFNESPEGAEPNDIYADNIKYLSLRSAETWGGTIQAYTYPDVVAELDGSKEVTTGVRIFQQSRGTFGISVRTLIGNDTKQNDYGYMIKLVYGLTMSPSEKDHSTVNDSPEAAEFSWELDSIPVDVEGYKPTSLIEIDSTKVSAEKLKAFEDILYGTDDTYTEFSGSTFESDVTYYEKSGTSYVATSDSTPDADKTYYTMTAGTDGRLPMPAEVIAFFKETTNG